jgi:heat shock protein HtpX
MQRLEEEFVMEFTIDISIPEIYFEEMLKFIQREFLFRNPIIFKNIKIFEKEGKKCLSFIIIKPGTDQYVNVELEAKIPINVKVSSIYKELIEEIYEELRENLIINIEWFQEKIRRAAIYFAWIEGKEVIPEASLSMKKKAYTNIFTRDMITFYILSIIISIIVFSLFSFYAPIIILIFQFSILFFSDRIALRIGEWIIDSKNKYIHFIEYYLSIEELREFREKYDIEIIRKIKREIYEKTLAIGKKIDCEIAQETLSKYGIKCVPERMKAKVINVYELVEKASKKINVKMPKIVILNTMIPNAAATGISPNRSTILITTGLLIRLEEEEILSVIGHELGHLKGRDPLILFCLSSIEYLLRLYVFLPFYILFPFFYLMIALGIVYFIAKFFEARADLISAIKLGEAKKLAEALRKIGFYRLQYERIPFYRFQEWISWDPHPPLYFRIKRLEKLSKEKREIKYPLIESIKDVINGFLSTF